MSFQPRKVIGVTLLLFGVSIVVFSQKIVFPGLERLFGIETIVGAQNVVYQSDGSYAFTNPGAMMLWILAVVVLGILIGLTGVWVLVHPTQNKVMCCRAKNPVDSAPTSGKVAP